MSEKANLFVPQTDNHETVLETVCRRFSEEFGGATVRRDHEGYWVDDDGNLVDDTVDVAFTYDDDIDETVVKELAEYVKAELGEDAVLYTIEEAKTAFV
mgnify:FL=1